MWRVEQVIQHIVGFLSRLLDPVVAGVEWLDRLAVVQLGEVGMRAEWSDRVVAAAWSLSILLGLRLLRGWWRVVALALLALVVGRLYGMVPVPRCEAWRVGGGAVQLGVVFGAELGGAEGAEVGHGAGDAVVGPVPPGDAVEGFDDGLGEAKAEDAGGVADDDGEGGDVFGDDGAGADGGTGADGAAGEDDGGVADPDVVADGDGGGSAPVEEGRVVGAHGVGAAAVARRG